jgi:HSP20 family protein
MLLRFDPFRGVDRLTEDVWGSHNVRNRPMPIDVYRAGDEFVAFLDVPGVSPDSIELTVDKNVLTITAERPAFGTEGAKTLISERPSGQFTRRLHLGDGLDLGNVQAAYDQGVLKVTIPVAEQAKPRKVEVTVSAPQVAIVAEVTEPQADAA